MTTILNESTKSNTNTTVFTSTYPVFTKDSARPKSKWLLLRSPLHRNRPSWIRIEHHITRMSRMKDSPHQSYFHNDEDQIQKSQRLNKLTKSNTKPGDGSRWWFCSWLVQNQNGSFYSTISILHFTKKLKYYGSTKKRIPIRIEFKNLK